MMEWTPDATRTMLSGRSGYWYSVWMLRLAACEVVLCIALLLSLFANQAGIMPRIAFLVVIGIFAANALMVFTFWAAGEIRQRREVRAGYTTVFDAWRNVEQVDDRTGHVIRLANEQVGVGEVKMRRYAVGQMRGSGRTSTGDTDQSD